MSHEKSPKTSAGAAELWSNPPLARHIKRTLYTEGDTIRLVLDNLASSIGIRKQGLTLATSTLSSFQFVFRPELWLSGST